MAAAHQTPQGSHKMTASKGRKRLKHIKVDAANGGFVASHHYKPEYGGTPKPEKHVFADHASLEAHLRQHMGDK